MESNKETSGRRQAAANLVKLKERFDTLGRNVYAHAALVYTGSKETALEDTMPVRMSHMQRGIQIIERGVAHGEHSEFS
jgi:hypothetical protein